MVCAGLGQVLAVSREVCEGAGLAGWWCVLRWLASNGSERVAWEVLWAVSIRGGVLAVGLQ